MAIESFLFGKDTVTLIINNLSMQKKMTELENKDKMKTMIVGTISHELRTPLNGILSLL